MRIQFIRHATLIIHINERKILVDPMLSSKAAMEAVQNADNQNRIPLVDLPLANDDFKKMLDELDGILVTHTHRDHWDTAAIKLLSKCLPVFCQAEDISTFLESGFSEVYPIIHDLNWKNLHFIRTQGKHGVGEIGAKMGLVSGFIIQSKNEPTLYIAGDTIWCDEVENALLYYKPEIVILNTGDANFLTGGRITMNSEDVLHVCRTLPNAKIIAVHLEAVNHCRLTRSNLKKYLEKNKINSHVMVPQDGDEIIIR